MKKLLLLLVFIGLLTTNVASASFDKNLAYGSRGSLVKELQEFLTDQGLYSGPITGNFYSLTLKAVKTFQSRETIKPSGYWNLATRTRANVILDLSDSDNEQINEPTFIPPSFTNPWIQPPVISNPVVVAPPVVQPAPLIEKLAPIQDRKFFFSGSDSFSVTSEGHPFIQLEGLKEGVSVAVRLNNKDYAFMGNKVIFTDISKSSDVVTYAPVFSFTYQDVNSGTITGTFTSYFAY